MKNDKKTDISRYVEIPTVHLVPAEWNYKKDDEAKKESLKNSLKRNGQIENIVVRELDKNKFEVINGNHRLEAMQEIGQNNAICYRYKKGEISLAQAKRIAAELNENRFENDPLKFAQLIKDINLEFDLTDLELSLPLNETELKDMCNMLEDYDWTEPVLQEKDGKQNKEEMCVTCPKCGHEFEVKGK